MKHRTALGKMIDMNALRTKNEHVRAVGNMSVNARGDTIDSHDNVIQDATKRVNHHYMRSVANRQRQDTQSQQPKSQAPVTDTAAQHETYNRSAVPSDLDDDIPNPKK